MGKYGTTAVRAAELLRNGYTSAEAAWRSVAEEVFRGAPQAEKKGCPKAAFLGLCAAGLIRDVSPAAFGEVKASTLNGTYAVKAAQLLAEDPTMASASQSSLWHGVMIRCGADPNKQHNSQMDVVLALWEANLIDTAAAS